MLAGAIPERGRYRTAQNAGHAVTEVQQHDLRDRAYELMEALFEHVSAQLDGDQREDRNASTGVGRWFVMLDLGKLRKWIGKIEKAEVATEVAAGTLSGAGDCAAQSQSASVGEASHEAPCRTRRCEPDNAACAHGGRIRTRARRASTHRAVNARPCWRLKAAEASVCSCSRCSRSRPQGSSSSRCAPTIFMAAASANHRRRKRRWHGPM